MLATRTEYLISDHYGFHIEWNQEKSEYDQEIPQSHTADQP